MGPRAHGPMGPWAIGHVPCGSVAYGLLKPMALGTWEYFWPLFFKHVCFDLEGAGPMPWAPQRPQSGPMVPGRGLGLCALGARPLDPGCTKPTLTMMIVTIADVGHAGSLLPGFEFHHVSPIHFCGYSPIYDPIFRTSPPIIQQ